MAVKQVNPFQRVLAFIAAVDCVSKKANPKKRMAALRAAILFLGFMSSYTWRQL
jgi:hypothetical protein